MSDETAPRFSVIVPVHNGERHVARCLQSVLDQSFQDFEIIVVDDGSTDGSAAEIARFGDPRCHVLRRERGGPGPGPARNMGIAAARSPWCAFLDADDRWTPDYLAQMADASRQLPKDVGLLFSGFEIAGGDGRSVPDRFYTRHREPDVKIVDFADFLAAWIANSNSPNRTSATIVRTDLLREIGGFPEDARCRRGQDKDTWLRATAKARAAYVPFIGMTYHTGSMDAAARAAWFNQAPCLCSSIADLLAAAPASQHRKLLRKLQNSEILGYVVEGSRVMRVPRAVFSDFFVADDPVRYALILALWMTPRPLLDRLRSVRRRARARGH